MKITTPLKSFDLQSIFNSCSDYTDRLWDGPYRVFVLLATLKQREERYDRDISEFCDVGKPFEKTEHFNNLERALMEGETLVLPFAEPNVGESIRCADGQEYDIDTDTEDESEYPSSEFIAAVLMLKYHPELGEVTISTGIEAESITMTGISFSEQSIGSLDKPAEEFVRRFIKS